MGFERAWWQTFVYVFLLVHRFKGQHACHISADWKHIAARLRTVKCQTDSHVMYESEGENYVTRFLKKQ